MWHPLFRSAGGEFEMFKCNKRVMSNVTSKSQGAGATALFLGSSYMVNSQLRSFMWCLWRVPVSSSGGGSIYTNRWLSAVIQVY